MKTLTLVTLANIACVGVVTWQAGPLVAMFVTAMLAISTIAGWWAGVREAVGHEDPESTTNVGTEF
jgi:hypothetical protein